MSTFTKLNVDRLLLGTIDLSGVIVSFFASNRTPFDGQASNTPWADATAYIIGDARIYRGNYYVAVANHLSSLGVNDPESDTYNMQGLGSFWQKVDGQSGDMWVYSGGAASQVYQKLSNVWVALKADFPSAGLALTDSATNALAFTYSASSYRTAVLEYYIQSGAGNFERGQMNVVNDGVNASGVVHNVNSIGTDQGIDWFFSVSAGLVEVRYNSTAMPTGRNLFYILRK